MGFLDKLLGREPMTQDRQPSGQAGGQGYGQTQTQPYAGHSSAGPQDSTTGATPQDQQAIARYRYLLRTAPPEQIEQAHAEAFAGLTPSQRQQVLGELTSTLPAGERPQSDDPQQLARAATRAEMNQPGYLQRTFGGQRGAGMGGGMGGGGMGGGMMGMIGGSMLGTIAGVVIGTAIADSFMGGFDGSPEQTDAGGDTGDAGGDSGGDPGADAGGDAGGDPGGDVGATDAGYGDTGGDQGGFGDFGGGDFGGGDSGGGDFGGGDFGGGDFGGGDFF